MRYLLLPLCLLLSMPAYAQPIVQHLSSGVVVTHTEIGAGRAPGPSSTVEAHYRGELEDGTEFDSSYKRGQPAAFDLREVIPCWTEALLLMREGGTATVECPASSAYGADGAPGVIPPHSALRFEVRLLSIF